METTNSYMRSMSCGPNWLMTMQTMLIILMSLPDVCSALSCYKCDNEASNFMCMDKEEPCDDRMDTCQTIVSYSDVSAKLEITKTCTKNLSCELQINATRKETPCDKSRSSWICTYCCYDNGCNVDVAMGTHVTSYTGVLAGLLAAYTIVHMCGYVEEWT